MADEENEVEDGAEKSGGGMMKMIMFGGIAVVLLAVGVFAGPAVMNMISPPEVAEDSAAAEEEPKDAPALYTSLHPPLVVNFKDAVGDSHFMQITMEVMARDQDVINSIRDHTPAIRNGLILLFSGAVYEEVTTRQGKEQLLADGLAEIKKVMEETGGESAVEAVYFTSLVIQ